MSTKVGEVHNLLDDVVIRKSENVNPSQLSGDMELYCAWNCPSGNLSEQSLALGGDPMLDTSSSSAVYSFDASSMTLKHNGSAVVFPDDLDTSTIAPWYEYGLRSGVLVETESALNQLETGGDVATWYEWETGLQTWNRSYWATENEEVITIDPPRLLSFTFEAAKDRDGSGGDYYDEPFFVRYTGSGNLDGLPYVGDGKRFKPAISLADGARVKDVESGDTYVLKAREMEVSFNQKDRSACGDLALEEPETALPTARTAEVNEAAVPDLPDTPSVVDGEVK